MMKMSTQNVDKASANAVIAHLHMQSRHLYLVVDLDERGSFKAHVEDGAGKSIFQFSNEAEETGWPNPDGLWLVEDGYMRHGRDIKGLLEYLQAARIAELGVTLSLAK